MNLYMEFKQKMYSISDSVIVAGYNGNGIEFVCKQQLGETSYVVYKYENKYWMAEYYYNSYDESDDSYSVGSFFECKPVEKVIYEVL